MAGAQVRPDHRLPGRGRDGHRRWRHHHRGRGARAGPVLGPPRWWWQLRHRHTVHDPAPSRGPVHGRRHRAARHGRRGERGPCRRSRRAGRPDRHPGPDAGAAAPVRPGRAPRLAGFRGPGRLDRLGRGGPARARPIRAIAPAIGDMVAPMPYPAIYSLAEAAAHRRRLPLHVPGRARPVDRGVAHRGHTVAAVPMAMVQLRVLGGAMAAVPSDATAFAHRSLG